MTKTKDVGFDGANPLGLSGWPIMLAAGLIAAAVSVQSSFKIAAETGYPHPGGAEHFPEMLGGMTGGLLIPALIIFGLQALAGVVFRQKLSIITALFVAFGLTFATGPILVLGGSYLLAGSQANQATNDKLKADITAVGQRYNAKLEALKLTDMFRPANLAHGFNAADARAKVTQGRSDLDEFHTQFDALYAQAREDIAQKVPLVRREKAMAAYDRGFAGSTVNLPEVWRLQGERWDVISTMVDVLAKRRWVIREGRPVFMVEADLTAYNGAIERNLAISRRLDDLRIANREANSF